MAKTKGKFRYKVQQQFRYSKVKTNPESEDLVPANVGDHDQDSDIWVDLDGEYDNHSEAQRSIKTHRRKGIFRTAAVSPVLDGFEEAPKEPVYQLKERT